MSGKVREFDEEWRVSTLNIVITGSDLTQYPVSRGDRMMHMLQLNDCESVGGNLYHSQSLSYNFLIILSSFRYLSPVLEPCTAPVAPPPPDFLRRRRRRNLGSARRTPTTIYGRRRRESASAVNLPFAVLLISKQKSLAHRQPYHLTD